MVADSRPLTSGAAGSVEIESEIPQPRVRYWEGLRQRLRALIRKEEKECVADFEFEEFNARHEYFCLSPPAKRDPKVSGLLKKCAAYGLALPILWAMALLGKPGIAGVLVPISWQLGLQFGLGVVSGFMLPCNTDVGVSVFLFARIWVWVWEAVAALVVLVQAPQIDGLPNLYFDQVRTIALASFWGPISMASTQQLQAVGLECWSVLVEFRERVRREEKLRNHAVGQSTETSFKVLVSRGRDEEPGTLRIDGRDSNPHRKVTFVGNNFGHGTAAEGEILCLAFVTSSHGDEAPRFQADPSGCQQLFPTENADAEALGDTVGFLRRPGAVHLFLWEPGHSVGWKKTVRIKSSTFANIVSERWGEVDASDCLTVLSTVAAVVLSFALYLMYDASLSWGPVWPVVIHYGLSMVMTLVLPFVALVIFSIWGKAFLLRQEAQPQREGASGYTLLLRRVCAAFYAGAWLFLLYSAGIDSIVQLTITIGQFLLVATSTTNRCMIPAPSGCSLPCLNYIKFSSTGFVNGTSTPATGDCIDSNVEAVMRGIDISAFFVGWMFVQSLINSNALWTHIVAYKRLKEAVQVFHWEVHHSSVEESQADASFATVQQMQFLQHMWEVVSAIRRSSTKDYLLDHYPVVAPLRKLACTEPGEEGSLSWWFRARAGMIEETSTQWLRIKFGLYGIIFMWLNFILGLLFRVQSDINRFLQQEQGNVVRASLLFGLPLAFQICIGAYLNRCIIQSLDAFDGVSMKDQDMRCLQWAKAHNYQLHLAGWALDMRMIGTTAATILPGVGLTLFHIWS